MKLIFIVSVTHLIFIGNLLELSYGKSDTVRVCVAANQNLKNLNAVKSCEQLTRSKKTQATCVFAADRIECLRYVSERRADLTLLEAEDVLFTARSGDLYSVLVVSEVRELASEPYEYQAVVVIRAKHRIRPDLKGARLCHPGWTLQDGRSGLFTQYLEERLAPQSCNGNLSLLEDRLKTSAAYFGTSCKAGVWSSDRDEDGRLKTLYPQLCDACDNPEACSMSDIYWGDGGAATCLNDGAGTALWAKLGDVRIHFQKSLSDEDRGQKYEYLCEDGTVQRFTNNSEPCAWLARPWPVIVANSKIALDVQKILAQLNDDAAQEWEESLLRVFQVSKEYIVNLETAKTPLDYLNNVPGYVSANDMTVANCNPRHETTWCVTSKTEERKCTRIARAAAAFAVAPVITCVQLSQLEQCMDAVAVGDADVVAVPPDAQPAAVVSHGLEPIFLEDFKTVQTGHFFHAFVKRDSPIRSLKDLRYKRACFPRYNGLAWRAVLVKLRDAGLVSTSCGATGVLQDFFDEICVASAASNYPSCNQEPNYATTEPEAEAFRGLARNQCDVAFISNATVLANTDGRNPATWTNYLRSRDFRPVCSNEHGFECAWAWSAPSAIMASPRASNIRRAEARHVFAELSRVFLRRNKSKALALSIFGPFDGEKNVIFQDGSSDLTAAERFVYERYNATSSRDIIAATRFCSAATTILPNFLLVFVVFTNF